ncbi:flagellar motor protein MotB [Stutzerimonas azotifigens]|uniref:flagellar motor protein MotB n=1 Tax=Stutzerimonas azotifigens TaxID=291995 RepID=UPI000410868C|nr:flagellar motor protein MotB [Stutzerimonas azotifigens]
MDNSQPIIIKRVRRTVGGHHGGSWKIAFADFATAMMAFFLVLWLLSSATPEQKKAISGYFQDPIGFTESASPYAIDLGGSPTPAPAKTLNPQLEQPVDQMNDPSREAEQIDLLAERIDRERLELLLQELQNKVEANPDLRRFKDQILFEITQDGLRIQIVDAENRPMFDLGSARLKPYFEDILLAMADTISEVPNKISVSGHTDAKPFSGRSGIGNWELSAERANAARRALVAGGYPEGQIARVVGYASSALFDRADPLNPVNRRIDIIVLTKKAQREIEGEVGEGEAPAEPAPATEGALPPASAPAPANAQPAQTPEPLPAGELQQRLNIFEDGVLRFDQSGQD